MNNFSLSIVGTIEVTLDTYQGTLSFTDLDTTHGNYGVAFNGLKGLVLVPAFSLFSADNSVTLAAGLENLLYYYCCYS